MYEKATKASLPTYLRFNKLHKVLSISIICLSLILCKVFYGVPIAAVLSSLLLLCNIVYTSNKHKIVPTTFSYNIIYIISYVAIEVTTYIAVMHLVNILSVKYDLTELHKFGSQLALVIYMVFVSIIHIYYYLNGEIYEVFGLEESALHYSDSNYFLLEELQDYKDTHRYLIQLAKRLAVHLIVPVTVVTTYLLSRNVGYLKYMYYVIASLCCMTIIILRINEHKGKKGGVIK